MPKQRPIAAAPPRTAPGPGAGAGEPSAPTAPTPTEIELDPEELLAGDNYPQSAYNYGTWTAEDDGNLLRARARGHHWAELQRTYFPTKTANACRKRYERLVERRGVYDYDARRFERIATEYMAMRKHMWSGLAARVGERWPVVEAQCMAAGLRTIQSSSRSHTNRWRREAKMSQKAARQAQDAVAGGRDDDVNRAHDVPVPRAPPNPALAGGSSRDMMPPPPPPSVPLIPPIQPAPPSFAVAPPVPVEPGLAPVEPGGFLGQLEEAGWRDDDYRFDDTGCPRGY